MARPRIVALITDFGTTDVYAGVVRGIIQSMAPDAVVVDITHGVPPGDRHAAAFMLLSSVPFLPRGSVHLCVVDPGVGSERRLVAARAAGHTFVAPDNGLLAPVLEALGGANDVRVLTNERLQRKRRSATFHGRDIMAPVVAHLVRGIDFAVVGEEIDDLSDLPGFSPDVAADRICGRVLHVDHFGNLVTNILPGELEGGPAAWAVATGGTRIERFGSTFSDAPAGELIVYTGSVGFLEIAKRDGSAAEQLGATWGSEVTAERRTS